MEEEKLNKIREFWNVTSLHDAKFERVSKSKTQKQSESAFRDEVVNALIDDCIIHDDIDLANSTILDFGCGVGRILKQVSKRSETCYGADISPNMLKYAKEYVDNDSVQFLLCDPKIPAESDMFDLVYTFHVLQHIPTRGDLINALSEIRRILKPSGRAVLHFIKKISETDKEPGSFAGYRPTQEVAVKMCEDLGYVYRDVKIVEGGSFILYLGKEV